MALDPDQHAREEEGGLPQQLAPATPPPLPEQVPEAVSSQPFPPALAYLPPAAPPPRPFPGFWQTIGLMLIVFFVQVVFGMALLFASGGTKATKADLLKNEAGLWILGAANVIAFACALLAGHSSIEEGWRARFRAGVFPRALLGPFLACATGGLFLALGAAVATNTILKNTPLKKLVETDFLPKGGIIPTLFLLCLVAPITEEIFFRGLVLGGFLKRYTERKALVLSSLLFATMHVSVGQFLPTLIVGLLFGWWRVRTNGILTPLLAHAVHNGVAGALILAAHNRVPGSVKANVPDMQLLVSALVFAALGASLLVPGLNQARLVLRNNPEPPAPHPPLAANETPLT